MENFRNDVHFGLRMLRRAPAFTAIAIVTLALGIGANTAIFSIVNAVLLRSLPFKNPDRLVEIIPENRGFNLKHIAVSVPEMEDLRKNAGVFEEVAGVWPINANLTGGDHPERVEAVVPTPNYFRLLGAQAQLGTTFNPENPSPGFTTEAVISDGMWARLFGRSKDVVGKRIYLDGDAYTVIGVMPRGFRHPGTTIASDVDVWASANFSADPFPKPARSLRFVPRVIATLKPGVSVEQANARLASFGQELRRAYPNDYPDAAQWNVQIESMQESLVGNVRPLLLVLFGSVMLIILISSVNVANLLLARASGRQREIAIRLALGATRQRIMRQMLTESVLLAMIGAVIGVLAAYLTLDGIVSLVPSKVPRLNEVRLDLPVLAFSLLLSFTTGVLFGFAPALQTAKANAGDSLREGSSGSGYSVRTNRLRSGMIVAEFAMAVVLMVSAGLLLRTFQKLMAENPGFNPTHVTIASLWLPVPNDPKVDRYGTPAQVGEFQREVVRRVKALPGVQEASVISKLPMSGNTNRIPLTIEERLLETSSNLTAELIGVSPEYFKVVQVPLVAGRHFEESDTADKPRVAAVDAATAQLYWPGQNPIGKRLQLGRPSAQAQNVPWYTIVGVVGDTKFDGLDLDGLPHLYVSSFQIPFKTLSLAIRSSVPASALESEIKSEVQAVDPTLPVFNVRTMDDVVSESLAQRRFAAQLLSAFAVLAVLLSAIGIYGLLAYMVNLRTKEISVRIALGASMASIRSLIFGHSIRLAGAGIAIGIGAALLFGRFISSLLYAVNWHDARVFMTVPLMLVVLAISASYLPARRAAQIDPARALRTE